MKSMKRFPPRTAACVTAAPAPKAGKILESGDASALCAERSTIVTSMQLTISSRRDIAVLQKESSALEGEEDVNSVPYVFAKKDDSAGPSKCSAAEVSIDRDLLPSNPWDCRADLTILMMSDPCQLSLRRCTAKGVCGPVR
jgi:hypothetical protein